MSGGKGKTSNAQHRTSNPESISPLTVECSSFAFATARQVGACHAEAFGVGGLSVRRFFSSSCRDDLPRLRFCGKISRRRWKLLSPATMDARAAEIETRCDLVGVIADRVQSSR